jgi:hypothetical protein
VASPQFLNSLKDGHNINPKFLLFGTIVAQLFYFVGVNQVEYSSWLFIRKNTSGLLIDIGLECSDVTCISL